jgi:hypothetical protein
VSQNPTAQTGQVSADGQFRWDGTQWVPIPRGEREATPWTRPMQLAAAGLFAVEAVLSVVFALLYIHHDTVVKVLKAQGTQIPQGTTIDDVANISLGVAIGVVVFVAVLGLVAAVGSYLGWRWMFWAALVLFGLGSIGALTNLAAFSKPDASYYPVWVTAVNEVLSLAALAMFVWMLIGVIRFGPWAMKKPGR